ncbi:MAG: hypothetical protein M1839_003654 [Geoglossum umbratile]|nr:MAG: hypothetical protein M1839_003654 [Geoglossum umbratile]
MMGLRQLKLLSEIDNVSSTKCRERLMSPKEYLLNCKQSDSATSSSSEDKGVKEEEEEEEEREGRKGMDEFISDANYVKHQPGSQKKANLLAGSGLKIEVGMKADSPSLSTSESPITATARSRKEDGQGGQSSMEREECAKGGKVEGAGGDDHPV